MLNPQNWLEKNYSDQENTTEIEFNSYELEFNQGELTITDYPKLEKIRTTANWNRNIKNITKLTINNCPQLVEINIADWVDNQELIITNCPNLTELYCKNNQLTQLDLSDCSDLTWLDCRDNKNLTGNLQFLQNLTQLETLDIKKTQLTSSFQYLPLSLKTINCDLKIKEELTIYNNSLTAWQAIHSQLMQQAGKELVVIDYTKSELKIVTTTPKYLEEKLKEETVLENNHQLTNLNYDQFALRDDRPFSWEKVNLAVTYTLPLRLYNFATKQVVTTANRNDISHYLALSYMWGGGEKEHITTAKVNDELSYEVNLTKLGKKALDKAIKAWKLIKQDSTTPINHIWIDNFCIDQKSSEKDENGQTEKGREVAKQKEYYNNATATLIAIDGEIGQKEKRSELAWVKHIIKQIATSPWFTRSWTFQEGLLSKQTIFMFDDGLVDGRILAQYWGGLQQQSYSYNDYNYNFIEFKEYDKHSIVLNNAFPAIFITPLGWSYGTQKEQKVELSLSQALHAVAHRQQTVPVDGIYSILGLLPYGNKVSVEYKEFGHKYTSQELDQFLLSVMRVAMKENPIEPLLWFGDRRNKSELWWIPEVKENGSTNIEGSETTNIQPKDFKLTETEIEMIGDIYRVFRLGGGGPDGVWCIEGGIRGGSIKRGDILVTSGDDSAERIIISVSSGENYNGSISRIMWGWLDHDCVSKQNQTPQKMLIDVVNKKLIIGEEEISQYQARIEVNIHNN